MNRALYANQTKHLEDIHALNGINATNNAQVNYSQGSGGSILNNNQNMNSNIQNINNSSGKGGQPQKILTENYDHQNSDSSEVKELKNRMKIIMNKLNNTKREKEQMAKENKSLQEEVMTLQANLRQMISGFSNTSSSFPMLNELADQIQEFYKYDCLDIFFDLLCPELNMKGILFFFHTSFLKLTEAIQAYLHPPQSIIKKVGCFENIEGPIMNVLRKSYQQNYKKIMQKCLHKDLIENTCQFIQQNLKLGNMEEETNQTIQQFLLKLGELLFYFFIADPPLQFDYKTIGTKVQFNSLKQDPFDGFIKNKQECIIILPSVLKQTNNSNKAVAEEGEIITKALVLQADYEIPN